MPDGRVKHVHERGETHFSATGEPLRTMGTVRDVTSSLQNWLALERADRDLRLLSDFNTALVHAEENPGLLTEICRHAWSVAAIAWHGWVMPCTMQCIPCVWSPNRATRTAICRICRSPGPMSRTAGAGRYNHSHGSAVRHRSHQE